MRRNEAHASVLEDQIDEGPMEVQIARIESDVSHIQKNLARVELEVQGLRKGQEAANEAITDIKVAVATTNGKLELLSKGVNALEDRAATLETKVDNLETRFDKLEAKVDHVDAKVTETNKLLGDKINVLDDKVSAIGDKVSEVADGLARLTGIVNTIGVAIALLIAIVAIGRATGWLLGWAA